MNRYILTFTIISFFGWVWECLYCSSKNRKWENRGFLFGPICPIYGFGGIFALALYDLGENGYFTEPSSLQIFILGFLVSMVLEYPTSYILEKLFKARWWDYSYLPLNINGRTSVPSSIAFGLAGILIFKSVIPWTNGLISSIPTFGQALLSMIAVAFFSSDTTLTVVTLTDFQKHFAQLDKAFDTKMEEVFDNFYKKQGLFKKHALSRVASFNQNEINRKLKAIIDESKLTKKIKNKK